MSEITEVKNTANDIYITLPSSTPVRESARVAFQQLGLPHVKTEEYRHNPITLNLEKNFNFASLQNPTATLKSIKDFEIPEFDAHVVVMLNGEFSETLSKISTNQLTSLVWIYKITQEE